MKIQSIVYIVVLLGMISCGNAASNSSAEQRKNQSFDSARLESERAAWESQNMNQYRFTGRSYLSNKKTVPIMVTVLPDAEPELSCKDRWKDVGEKLISSGIPFSPFEGKTIDELYSSIKEVMESYSNKNYGTYIRYDQTYHYPAYLEIYSSVSLIYFLEMTEFEDLR